MGKGRNGRHRAAKLTARVELAMSNSELQFLLHEANAELAELRAHQHADRRDLERLRSQSDGLDLDRLARVLRGALDRIYQREDLLTQVTRAYEHERVQAGIALEHVSQLSNANERLHAEVSNLKRVAEDRRVLAEKIRELQYQVGDLEMRLTEARLRQEIAQEELRQLHARPETAINKQQWRMLAQLVHPDIHVEERKARATEAMQLLNTTLRPS